jgi:hypothetical protein
MPGRRPHTEQVIARLRPDRVRCGFWTGSLAGQSGNSMIVGPPLLKEFVTELDRRRGAKQFTLCYHRIPQTTIVRSWHTSFTHRVRARRGQRSRGISNGGFTSRFRPRSTTRDRIFHMTT